MDPEQWLKLHDEWLELHHRAIVEHDEWLERHNRAIAEHDRRMAEMREEHNREINSIRQMLQRAVRLAVQEARAERRKRRELDDKITRLSSSHLLTEEAIRDLKATVDAFIASLRRGGNGNPS